MAFTITKEWLEGAKNQPVSFKTVLFICQLMTENMPKSDAKYKYFNQLKATILSCNKGTICKNTGKKGTFSQRMAHDWIEKNKPLPCEKRKLPKMIADKHAKYQEPHAEEQDL